jgi:hypothetical protein
MNRIRIGFAISIFLLVDIILTYLIFIKGNSHVYQENELIENLQAILLTISCIVFLIYSPFVERSLSLIPLSLSLLCFSFLLRELDVEDFAIPAFFRLIGSGTGRNVMLSVLWIFTITYMVFSSLPFRKIISSYLSSKSGVMLLICAGFLIAGALFDSGIIGLEYSTFYEEFLELNGYYMLLMGSLMSHRSLQGITLKLRCP